MNRPLIISSIISSTPYGSFEQRVTNLSADEMRAMLRSIFMDLYPEGADTPEWDGETMDSVAETFWCMGFVPPLKTEQNTPEMRERIEAAFLAYLDTATGDDNLTTEVFFEHGQWWARCENEEREDSNERTFSVVDAEPGIDGFGFEET